MVQSIVVATDFSANASVAVNWAANLAKAHMAEVVLVHAIESELPLRAEWVEPLRNQVRYRLELLRGYLVARGLNARVEFDEGESWEVIARIAKEANADLIVLGAHQGSSLGERVLGSTADRLLRSSSIPVLVHRDYDAAMTGSGMTVLVATNFSEESTVALSAAMRLVRRLSSRIRVVLIHCIGLPIHMGEAAEALALPGYWQDAEREAARNLETAAAPLRSDRITVETKTLRGFAGLCILEEAEAINADLVVIGTIGRTGLSRLVIGSVAEHVLHHSRRPVLAARRRAASEPIGVCDE